MAQVYKKLILDVYEDGRKIVTAVQNDTQSRYLDLVLTDGSMPIDLTGHEVKIYGVKPEGGGEFFNNGEITDPTAGRCQFEMTTQVLAKAGYVKAQIIIYYNNQQILSTREFQIYVVKSLMSDAPESSNEFGAVVTLFQDVYDMREVITEMNVRLGEKDSDSSVEGNSDGLFGLANISAKINRIMNYFVTQSTAGIVETVNAILGRIGAHDSTNDTDVMGRLNKGAVKRVQSGVANRASQAGSDSYLDVVISPVNINKSIVLVDANTFSSTSTSAWKFPCAQLINSTTLRVYNNYLWSGSNSIQNVYWQVVEFN